MMTSRTRTMFTPVALAIGIVAAAPAIGQVITVWPEAVVTRDTVTLGDIGRISGADHDTALGMKATPLTSAPGPGESMVIDTDRIRQALTRTGANLALVTIRGAARCTVHRPQVTATGTTVAGAVPVSAHDRPRRNAPTTGHRTLRDFLIGYLASRVDRTDGSISVSFGRHDRAALDLAEPQFSFEVHRASGRRLGVVGIDVDILSGGRRVRSESIAATVSWVKQVVVANRPINRGATIRANDVRMVKRRFQRLSRLGVSDPAAVVGQRARRFIPVSQAVMYADLEPVPLVKRGQMVEVRSQRGAVSIVTAAKALGEGVYGETIDLRYAGRRDRVMQGVVVGPGKVAIGVPPGEPGDRFALQDRSR